MGRQGDVEASCQSLVGDAFCVTGKRRFGRRTGMECALRAGEWRVFGGSRGSSTMVQERTMNARCCRLVWRREYVEVSAGG
jgi:hypothetical protein